MGIFIFHLFFSIIIILLVAAGVPKTPKDKPAVENQSVKLNAASWGIFVMAILFGILSSAMFSYISYIVVDAGLGSSAVAGTASSIVQIGSFCGSLLMAVIYARFKGYIEPIGWLAMCLGGIIFMASALAVKSLLLAYIGGLIFGFSNGLLFPWLYAKAAIVCAPNTEAKTIATANIGYYIGMFTAIFFYEAMLTVFNATANITVFFMIAGSGIYFVFGIIRTAAKHGELTGGSVQENDK